MKMNVKPATIARIGALLVALANQILAVLGRGALPITENMAYQIISLIATIIIVLVNAWYNNDITKLARLAGSVFDSLKDGTLDEKEISDILESHKDENLQITDK